MFRGPIPEVKIGRKSPSLGHKTQILFFDPPLLFLFFRSQRFSPSLRRARRGYIRVFALWMDIQFAFWRSEGIFYTSQDFWKQTFSTELYHFDFDVFLYSADIVNGNYSNMQSYCIRRLKEKIAVSSKVSSMILQKESLCLR